MTRITSVDALRTLYKAPHERAVKKQLDRIDTHGAHFIALSPFCLIATHDDAGGADVSPRGDAPGFVHVLDHKHIALPDRPGNNRLDSLENIIAHPAVGMIFLVPGVQETLRINGTAEIRDDQELRARFAVDGREPATVLVVEVHEAFLHCAKSIMRSKLWDPETRIDRAALPSMGQMLKDQIGLSGEPEPQDAMIERYKEALY
jgi:PPOX class probable FMN-dependent enzyme